MSNNRDLDKEAERFQQAFHVLMHNLGPNMIRSSGVGLTPPQVFALRFVGRSPRCTVTNLAEKMEVKPSAITVMLDRLEGHGLVRRTRDEDDRRVVRVELTEEGEGAFDRIRKMWQSIVRQCLSQLPEAEVAAFMQTLERLSDISQKVDPKAALADAEADTDARA